MLLRVIALVLGLCELLITRPLVDFWMGLAAEGDDIELRPWVYTAARVEGVLLIAWSLKGGCSRETT